MKNTTLEQEKQTLGAYSPDIVYIVDLDKIAVSPLKPQVRRRAKFDKTKLDSLGDSIIKHRLREPIQLRPVAGAKPLQIVYGERRFLASCLKGLKTIRAFVEEMPDAKVLELQYEENHRHQKNDPLDDAFYFLYLKDTEGYTEEELADRLNTTLQNVRDKLKLNDLIDEGKDELSSGKLPLKHAVYLAKFPIEAQAEIVKLQLAYKYHDHDEKAVSFEIFKEEVMSEIVRRLANAPFPTDDPRLHIKNLLCRDCSSNSAFATFLFPEFAGDARCLDKGCFELKTNTYLRLKREEIALDRPNPTNIPIEEIAREVPLVTDRRWTMDERSPFKKEKVLTGQELLEKPECDFSEISLAVEGAKKGQQVYICRNERCPVHNPPSEYDDDELTEMETDFDERVAMRVRLKVLKHALAWFDDRKSLWQFDDLVKNLIVEFLLNISPDYHADIRWLVSDWQNVPRKLGDREQLEAFVADLDKAKQSQILFLLSVIGTEDLEVLSIAKGYTEINFFQLDAETRLELAPDEFKAVAAAHLDAVRHGKSAAIPRFWQTNDFNDVPMVSDGEQ